MLTTKKLRKVLELVDQYHYDGAVDWMLPFLLVKTEYEEMLSNNKYGTWPELIQNLISLDEGPEIKEHRLELFDLFVESQREASELEAKAKSLDIPDPARSWSSITTPESKVFWDMRDSIPQYDIQNRARTLPIKLSSFEEIGKAIRAGVKVAGKLNYPSYTKSYTKYYHNETEKLIGWRTTSVVKIFEIRKAILDTGVRFFHIYSDKSHIRLVIKVPIDVFPEAFYTSDDIKIWKELHKKKENRIRVKRVTKALDKEI